MTYFFTDVSAGAKNESSSLQARAIKGMRGKNASSHSVSHTQMSINTLNWDTWYENEIDLEGKEKARPVKPRTLGSVILG